MNYPVIGSTPCGAEFYFAFPCYWIGCTKDLYPSPAHTRPIWLGVKLGRPFEQRAANDWHA